MLNAAQVVASSTIGAGVAVAVIVIQRHLQDQDTQKTQKEIEAQVQQARTDGYYQGRESIMQEFAANVQQHAEGFANSPR